jgi:CubicO group peptidase (beta-lactamase class C family)
MINIPDFKHLDTLLRDLTANMIPGCGCLIAKEGKTLFENYYGYSDLQRGIPVIENSVFRLYSMTKVIVCTAALMLFERGRFLLNDPIYEYLPEYRKLTVAKSAADGRVTYEESLNPILIKHAFAMSVGLPNPGGNDPTSVAMSRVREGLTQQYGQFDLQTEIRAMASVPLAFEPGTRFMYGYGHELVAGLIEVVSGKRIGQFLQDELFTPLGMTSTGYRYFGDIRERMAPVYVRSENGSWAQTQGAYDFLHEPNAILEKGGSGLFSTVRDYTKFAQMLANSGTYNGVHYIGRRTIDLMRANQLPPEALRTFGGPYNAGYGYGLGVRTMLNPGLGCANSPPGEFGWSGMLGTYTSIDPTENLSIVYMHQTMPNLEEQVHLRLRAAVYGAL